MKIENVNFCVAKWSSLNAVEHRGEIGSAFWKTFEAGNLRVRMVEYSAEYLADHWCSRGHVVLVLEGELTTELQDGRRFVTRAGHSYRVSEGAAPHRSST